MSLFTLFLLRVIGLSSHSFISFKKIQSSWPKMILLYLGILKKYVLYMIGKFLTSCRHNELLKSTFLVWFSFPRRPNLGSLSFPGELVTLPRVNQNHNKSIPRSAETEKTALFELWVENGFTWAKEWENKLVRFRVLNKGPAWLYFSLSTDAWASRKFAD